MFLLCWIPFFTCNILTAVALKTGRDALMPTMTLFLLTTWLGYVNSAMNPVIYTLFNHEFRKAFKKLVRNSKEILRNLSLDYFSLLLEKLFTFSQRLLLLLLLLMRMLLLFMLQHFSLYCFFRSAAAARTAVTRRTCSRGAAAAAARGGGERGPIGCEASSSSAKRIVLKICSRRTVVRLREICWFFSR